MKLSWRTIIGIAAIVAVGGFIVWRWQAGRLRELPRTVTAERRSVVQEINFTGRLQAEQTAVLAFEQPGVIAGVAVNVGDRVVAGQVLARADSRLASLEAARARADRASAQEQARIAWLAKEEELTNIRAENARTIEKRRAAVRDAKAELDQERLVHQQKAAESGDEASATKSAVVTMLKAQTAYHSAQQALGEAVKTVQKTEQSAQDAAALAEAQYQATLQASGEVAGLSSLGASEAIAALKVAKTVLRAPFDGVVTAKDVEMGEVVIAGQAAVTVQAVEQLELRADVPESDAVKLVVGMSADVTFDAYPSTQTWAAEVAHVAPAAVIIEGVPTYEVTLRLVAPDERLLPGLTATITVHGQEASNVVSLPRRAIISRGRDEFVHILSSDGQVAERQVTTGLRGSDGTVEILSGLSEGEQVVIDTTGP